MNYRVVVPLLVAFVVAWAFIVLVFVEAFRATGGDALGAYGSLP